MGTRGFIGFVAEEREVITYNHFDSYPEGVGCTVLAWARSLADFPGTIAVAQAQVAAMEAVADEAPPTDEQLEALAPYVNLSVDGAPGHVTWYQALRETQGNPRAILDAGFYEDAGKFPLDSLFCEWGYLLDFDTLTLEVYRGFQEAPHDQGRFADRDSVGLNYIGGPYYPVKLIASWPLNELPSPEEFCGLDASEDDEDEE